MNKPVCRDCRYYETNADFRHDHSTPGSGVCHLSYAADKDHKFETNETDTCTMWEERKKT